MNYLLSNNIKKECKIFIIISNLKKIKVFIIITKNIWFILKVNLK